MIDDDGLATFSSPRPEPRNAVAARLPRSPHAALRV